MDATRTVRGRFVKVGCVIGKGRRKIAVSPAGCCVAEKGAAGK